MNAVWVTGGYKGYYFMLWCLRLPYIQVALKPTTAATVILIYLLKRTNTLPDIKRSHHSSKWASNILGRKHLPTVNKWTEFLWLPTRGSQRMWSCVLLIIETIYLNHQRPLIYLDLISIGWTKCNNYFIFYKRYAIIIYKV